MSWEWPKTDERGLARFAIPDASQRVKLLVDRSELQQDANGRRTLVEAIYFALQGKGVRYALEKYHPVDPVQLIRTPSEILGEQSEGTCLDLALLFCGVCLGYELLPLIVLIEGHALAAVSMNYGLRERDSFSRNERKYFDDALLKDSDALRGMVEGGAYLAVECTGFASTKSLPQNLPEGVGRDFRGLLSFERAITAGREQLSFAARPFRLALDTAVAQNDLKFPPMKETEAQIHEPQKPEAQKKPVINIGEGIEIEDADELGVTGIEGGSTASDKDINILNGKAKIKNVKKINLVGESITIPKKEGEQT